MRLFLKILAGAIVLGAVLAAFALVPAHIQIRGVEPDLPSLIELLMLSPQRSFSRLKMVNPMQHWVMIYSPNYVSALAWAK